VLEQLAERLLVEEVLDEGALTEFFAKTELRLTQVQSTDDESRT